MIKIKICGLARFEDAALSASLGADYLGMVFYEKSKRLCSTELAKKIIHELSSQKVFVFGYDSLNRINDIASSFPPKSCFIQVPSDHPSLLELEQKFTPAQMIVSVPVVGKLDESMLKPLEKFHIIILDTGGQKDQSGNPIPGGTGIHFDWAYAKSLKTKYFLAGGLSDQNIRSALQELKPYGVDVSSGLEKIVKEKDHQKLTSFIKQVKDQTSNLKI